MLVFFFTYLFHAYNDFIYFKNVNLYLILILNNDISFTQQICSLSVIVRRQEQMCNEMKKREKHKLKQKKCNKLKIMKMKLKAKII